jgi:hypothetical protein
MGPESSVEGVQSAAAVTWVERHGSIIDKQWECHVDGALVVTGTFDMERHILRALTGVRAPWGVFSAQEGPMRHAIGSRGIPRGMATCLLILVGWLLPLTVAASYVYVQMPSATGLGLSEAYHRFGSDRLWLVLWGIGWILVSGIVATICVCAAVVKGSERRPLSYLKLILWPLVVVEFGSFLTSAPMSFAVSHLGYEGPIPNAWIGSGGWILGFVALTVALVLTVRDFVCAPGFA